MLGLLKERGRGKLAKLVEIRLGQPEQPMLPANHLLSAHKGRISGRRVKEYGAHKKALKVSGLVGGVSGEEARCLRSWSRRRRTSEERSAASFHGGVPRLIIAQCNTLY